MTLNGVIALILRYFTELGSFGGAYCMYVCCMLQIRTVRRLAGRTSP